MYQTYILYIQIVSKMGPAIFPINQFWEESTRQVWDGLGYGKDICFPRASPSFQALAKAMLLRCWLSPIPFQDIRGQSWGKVTSNISIWASQNDPIHTSQEMDEMEDAIGPNRTLGISQTTIFGAAKSEEPWRTCFLSTTNAPKWCLCSSLPNPKLGAAPTLGGNDITICAVCLSVPEVPCCGWHVIHWSRSDRSGLAEN